MKLYAREVISFSMFAFLIVLSAITGPLGEVFGPINQANGFGTDIHEQIIDSSLSFLDDPIIKAIKWGSIKSDVSQHQFNSNYHFDGCAFEGTTTNINNWYRAILADLNPKGGDRLTAATTFGHIIHAVSDFYSHTNWIESGGTSLVDDGTSMWTILRPFSQVKGMFVIQGENIDVPPSLVLTRQGKVVTVGPVQGKTFLGLMSGTIPYEPDNCPDRVTLGHWDLFTGEGSGLAKDNPGGNINQQTAHNSAVNLATLQTKHEWCRLVNLVDQTYGEKGKDVLGENWIKKDDKGNLVSQDSGCPITEPGDFLTTGYFQRILEDHPPQEKGDHGSWCQFKVKTTTTKDSSEIVDGSFKITLIRPNHYELNGTGSYKLDRNSETVAQGDGDRWCSGLGAFQGTSKSNIKGTVKLSGYIKLDPNKIGFGKVSIYVYSGDLVTSSQTTEDHPDYWCSDIYGQPEGGCDKEDSSKGTVDPGTSMKGCNYEGQILQTGVMIRNYETYTTTKDTCNISFSPLAPYSSTKPRSVEVDIEPPETVDRP